MTTHRTCPPVASPEAAAYDAADHSDCTVEDLRPEEEGEGETDAALWAELDREMQEEAEEWALLGAQMTAPAVGGLGSSSEPY